MSLLFGILKRLFHLTQTPYYNYIFIHRETIPFGPPILEWVIAKILKKKIIYDFDDAIWLNDPDENGTLKSKIKCKSKVAKICKWSYKVSVGNRYLANFARQFSDKVIINPTTIDTKNLHNPKKYKKRNKNKIKTIGWTGTHSTLQYLNQIIPTIKELEKEYQFRFLVIANKSPKFPLKSLVFKKWNKSNEINDLLEIDIGVMPLTDDQWSKGKGGFKALQYMSLNIPALVSPVGINLDIVDHDHNGFICQTAKDWKKHLSELLINDPKRIKMGFCARKKVKSNYSLKSNSANFLSLFLSE